MRVLTRLALVATAASLAACSSFDNPFAPDPLTAEVCRATTLPIYFEEGSDQLTAPARELIATTAVAMRRCRVGEVQVLGLADASGAAATNMDLSARRARTAAEALIAGGLPAPSFALQALGETGATVGGPVEEPVRRRAEITIAAEPR